VTPVPTVAVGAIVFDDANRVLLIQRGRPPGVGLWTLPGGKVHLREALAVAVEREVFEETGLAVRCGRLAEVVERVLEVDAPGGGVPAVYHYVILDYLAELSGAASEPRAGDDALDARWVGAEQLAELSLTEGLRPVLDRARALAGRPRVARRAASCATLTACSPGDHIRPSVARSGGRPRPAT
jgi:8-oxo-dGTP diphosphatase